MKRTLIEYGQNKGAMLSKGIAKAIDSAKEHKTIWLVWTDTNNLRGYSNLNIIEGRITLDATDIDNLRCGKRLSFDTFSLASISLKDMVNVGSDDIVIDCFTGMLFLENCTSATHLIHLPWMKHESDLLKSKI